MALRLILMGVVAGMGMNLPTHDDVASWRRAVECWVNARFDDWDSRMPVDGSAFRFGREAVASAEAVPALTVPLDDQFNAVVADMTAAFAKEMAPAVVVESPALVVEAPRLTPVQETLPLEAPAEPMRTEREGQANEDVAFQAVMDQTVGGFVADLAAHRPLVSKGDASVAAVKPRESDSAEGPARVSAVTKKSSTPSRGTQVEEDQFSHAMRLTREAVFAWAGLLHGPAVVTISR